MTQTRRLAGNSAEFVGLEKGTNLLAAAVPFCTSDDGSAIIEGEWVGQSVVVKAPLELVRLWAD